MIYDSCQILNAFANEDRKYKLFITEKASSQTMR